MSRDDAYALDVLQAARLSVEFKVDLDKAQFLEDPKTQSAVLHQLLVVGEAVKRLSKPFRQRHPEIAWKALAGMRDKLIHEYDDVDLTEVWNTVTLDMPRLIDQLASVVDRDPSR